MKPVAHRSIAKIGKKAASAAPKISGVDLFCGVGGLTHGLIQGGVEVAAGVDLDASCRFPYETNNKATFIEKDLRELRAQDIAPFFKKDTLRLLAGCAPCQPFSTYSQGSRVDNSNDKKWDLLLDFGRLIEDLKPELVTMENVPRLLRHSVFNTFLECLRGYHIWYDVVECAAYGIPQMRKRLVVLASKLGPIELIPPTHTLEKPLTVVDVIGQLPQIAAGENHPSDRLHAACSLSDVNLKRIKASKPGGTWRDWPQELRAKCHVKTTGQTYSSVYGRMEWGRPAPTITTQCYGFGNGRFGHPTQNRAISLREAAIIQTFPDDYQFVPNGSRVKFNILGRLIGNAVPVRLGKVVAESLKLHVSQLDKPDIVSKPGA